MKPGNGERSARRRPASRRANGSQVARAIAAGRRESPAAGAERERMIAQAAYFRAQARGFAPGQELEDWLQAEAEIDRGSWGS
jgi:hypothetical protein